MLFALKAIFIKKFESYYQKKFRLLKGFTFWQLRQEMIYSIYDLSIIFDQLERCMFCRESALQKAKYQHSRTMENSPN